MSRWGNPSAPKFWSGPKGWSVWNQEFSWKARCAKENKEFDAKVAASMGDYKDPGVSLNLAATNPNMTSDMTGASLGTVMREQAKLKGEFKAVMQLLTEKREQELRAKVLAENEAQSHHLEKSKIEAELRAYRKTVQDLKRAALSSSASARSGLFTNRSVRPATAAGASPLATSGASMVSRR